jgi:putative membrane protein
MSDRVVKPMPGSRSETVSAIVDMVGRTAALALAATSITRKQFIPHAIVANLYVIEAAKLALQRARRSDVREAARALLADHEEIATQLRSFIGGTNSPQMPPDSLDVLHQILLDDLNGAADEDFDKRYIAQQKIAFTEAMTLFKTYHHTARDDGLRSLIGLALPALEQQREMVRQLDREPND